MEKSDPFHVQKGIGAALLVAVGSPVSLEAHMLVEADGLRVLLVDRQFLQVVMANVVFQKLPSQSRAPLCRGKEQHFQTMAFEPHKGNRLTRIFSATSR